METSFKQVGYSGKEYFQQQAPHLGNQYLDDTYLLETLKRVLPNNIRESIEPDLRRFGDRVVKDILELGRASENNSPKLIQYDAWGKRIDKIVVDESWNILKDISAQEGLVSIGYERKQQEYSRLYQYLKIYLFACSSAVFDCPLSMTDGGARLLELHGSKDLLEGPYKHFISRDPKQFWTSGQWMTEKSGGSDVANSETTATEVLGKNMSTIEGYKYFTSATTSQTAIILARDCDSNGKPCGEGSRGLSAFYIQIRDPQTQDLNKIKIHKMKNKFGTKAVPTAELELLGTPGLRLGPKGRGVPVIASILNITRIHNVIHSVSTMRRCVALARDFSHRRVVFGSKLSENLLYLSTLAEMELEFRASLQFLVDVTLLFGRSEIAGKSSSSTDSLLRILTPLSKLYTAKQSIKVSSEGIECLGGTGYMEDSDMPRLLRDTQVTSIWEGTTNVLSMDVWRSIKTNNSLKPFLEIINQRLQSVSTLKQFQFSSAIIQDSVKLINEITKQVMEQMDMEYAESNARRYAYLLSETYMATLLLDHAKWSNKSLDIEVLNRWCQFKLKGSRSENNPISFTHSDANFRKVDRQLALDLNENGKPNVPFLSVSKLSKY
ncbi:putative acyl-CoA dehydrogenase [Tieghemostelium lacteum]|uniref:Putative acyl-CoA dehydrogenase n=1 Tax=Tieghemostelium lacteum TaxID=361077 RepID=A0A152A144_TIELA|nr:putative acyl-CoA dehydrogenase [Tieghemostelium lacteum]|eukprot:KYQ99945.1 putative acyl-CoA dehydrogenase [Tieghemostelium lacteum]